MCEPEGSDQTNNGVVVSTGEAELLKFIRLEEADTDMYFADHQNLFLPGGARGVFGGQTVCQLLHAAILSVPSEFAVHSFHGYFVQSGDPSHNILYYVNRVRDGKSFVTRTVEARQRGKRESISVATVQFHRPEPLGNCIEHQRDMPKVPGPEGLRSDMDSYREMAQDPKLSPWMRRRAQNLLVSPTKAEQLKLCAQHATLRPPSLSKD